MFPEEIKGWGGEEKIKKEMWIPPQRQMNRHLRSFAFSHPEVCLGHRIAAKPC